jgi:hypothetical protein
MTKYKSQVGDNRPSKLARLRYPGMGWMSPPLRASNEHIVHLQ